MKKINNTLYQDYTKDIYLSFTRKCNFDCAYCYCKNYLSDNTFPTAKKIDTFIAFIEKIPRLQTITLIGGEPFTYKKQLYYFLDKIQGLNSHRKEKIRISAFTNGSFYIDFRKYRGLIEEIVVALAGFGKEHNKIRYFRKGGQGSFDIIMANYKQYKLDQIPIRFNYVVSPNSIKNLFWSIENIIHNLQPFYVNLSVQFDHFSSWEKHPGEIIKYYVAIFKFNLKHKAHCIIPHHINQVGQSTVCTAGTSFIGVDLYSGKIHGCHENNGSNKDIIGSLQQGISDNIVQKNIKEKLVYHYHYDNIPYFLSLLLIKILGGNFCKMRNIHHCKKATVVPSYYLLIYLCTRIYNCLSKRLAQRTK